MPWLTLSELVERHSPERVATAAQTSAETIEVLARGETPSGDRATEEEAARSRIETAITDAVSEVESAVALRYELPLVEPPGLVKRLVGDRALFHLHGDVVPEDLESRRILSLSLLKAIRTGERLLLAKDGTPLKRRPRVRSSNPEGVFSGQNGTLGAY